MKEPRKIKLTDFKSDLQEPVKIPLKSIENVNHLYDEFGYILTLEPKNEDHNKNNS